MRVAGAQVDADHVLQRAGDEEVLLFQAKLLALYVRRRWGTAPWRYFRRSSLHATAPW